jgi:cytochrome P450
MASGGLREHRVMGEQTVVDLEGFNPFDPAVQQCPFPHYAAMREQAPVFQVPGTPLFLVTRYDLIGPILRDTATFSSSFGGPGQPSRGPLAERLRAVMAEGWPQVPTMLTIDPPQHTRYRGTVAPYFTPKRIGELRGPVRAIAVGLLDAVVDAGPVEVVERFAVPLPVQVIAHVLNVPPDRLVDFKRWSDDSIATIGAVVSDDRAVEAQRGIVEFQHYFADQLEQRRAEPRGDLMSDLVTAEVDTDDGGRRPLGVNEMLGLLQRLLVAGHATTTKALTEGIRLLAEHPHELAALRADPVGRAPALVEEILRLSTPTQGMFRVVTRDTELGGVTLPAGSRLVLVYAAANRDPEVWGSDPDGFDPGRPNLKEHLAFGKGIHFCLGAPLSRLEMQVAFEVLGSRVADISLVDGTPLEYFPSFLLRGLTRLDAVLTGAAPR